MNEFRFNAILLCSHICTYTHGHRWGVIITMNYCISIISCTLDVGNGNSPIFTQQTTLGLLTGQAMQVCTSSYHRHLTLASFVCLGFTQKRLPFIKQWAESDVTTHIFNQCWVPVTSTQMITTSKTFLLLVVDTVRSRMKVGPPETWILKKWVNHEMPVFFMQDVLLWWHQIGYIAF